MDRQTVVNLIRNEMVECPRGKSRLWAVRCFEITAQSEEAVVEVDEYEAYEVCEDKDGARVGDGRNPCFGSLTRMCHVGRSVIYLEEKRVVEEPAGKGRLEAGAQLAAR